MPTKFAFSVLLVVVSVTFFLAGRGSNGTRQTRKTVNASGVLTAETEVDAKGNPDGVERHYDPASGSLIAEIEYVRGFPEVESYFWPSGRLKKRRTHGLFSDTFEYFDEHGKPVTQSPSR